MSLGFDPYQKWLGIRTEERPPNHYALLGLATFEEDRETIVHAADRQMAHVRRFQSGNHLAESQRILNELAAAKLCLLKADKKTAYDQQLRAKLVVAEPPRATESAPPPPAPPRLVTPPLPQPPIAPRTATPPAPAARPSAEVPAVPPRAAEAVIPHYATPPPMTNRDAHRPAVVAAQPVVDRERKANERVSRQAIDADLTEELPTPRPPAGAKRRQRESSARSLIVMTVVAILLSLVLAVMVFGALLANAATHAVPLDRQPKSRNISAEPWEHTP